MSDTLTAGDGPEQPTPAPDAMTLPEGVERALKRIGKRYDMTLSPDEERAGYEAVIRAALDERDAEARKWKGHAQRADLRAREVATERAAREAAEARVRELEADAARLNRLEAELLEADGNEISLRFGELRSRWPRSFAVNDGGDYQIHSTLRKALDAYQAARQAGEVDDGE